MDNFITMQNCNHILALRSFFFSLFLLCVDALLLPISSYWRQPPSACRSPWEPSIGDLIKAEACLVPYS